MFLTMDLDFTEDEIGRYSRHILLAEVGGIGQARLRAARVLVVGAGGLGSPALLYLAAAGVGTIGVIDDDRVELSNLQRQIAHTTDRIGQPRRVRRRWPRRAINPSVRIEAHETRLDRRRTRSDLVAALRLGLRRQRQFSHALPASPTPACWPGARWSRPPCCASTGSSRCSSRTQAGRPATAACIRSRRRRAWCRAAARPACWGR